MASISYHHVLPRHDWQATAEYMEQWKRDFPMHDSFLPSPLTKDEKLGTPWAHQPAFQW